MARYIPDPTESELRVWTYKEGLLSRVAHDLCLEATGFEAPLDLEGDRYSVRVSVPVSGLRTKGQVKGERVVPLKFSDHQEIEKNLSGAKVLDGARFPAVVFAAEGTGKAGEGTLTVQGELTIKDSTRPLSFSTTLKPDGEGYRVEGELRLNQSEFGISPFSAMFGALKVKDGVRISLSLRYIGQP